MRTKLSDVFTDAFRRRAWRSDESVSGTGSESSQTEHLRRELPLLLKRLSIKSLLDIPCGDMNWMKGVDLGDVEYTGADIVRQIIEDNSRLYSRPNRRFAVLDLVSSELPEVDAVLCRDCLVHLPIPLIYDALLNICRSKARYLITTSFSFLGFSANTDCAAGEWRRLNLELSPFNFPPPLWRLIEGCTETRGAFADKSLGVWEIGAIERALPAC